MKYPKTPPDWKTLLANTLNKLGSDINTPIDALPDSQKYLHWDKLRYRNRPKNWSSEDWWTVLKFHRNSRYQLLPFKDSNDNPFVFYLTQHMFELIHQLDKKCGGTLSTNNKPDSVDIDSKRYYISSLIEESITSSQLEGASVTREIAGEMLRRKSKPKNKDEQMILNNFLTMKKIHELKDRELSQDLILEIHRLMTKDTLTKEDASGRYRFASEDIQVVDQTTNEIMHSPPDADLLPDRMEKLCAFANAPEMQGYLHPIIRSIILHFWLAYEHPFYDGNGRTARALFYWCMLKHGYWMMEYISLSSELLKAPIQYYRAFLYTETDENDLNYFIIHQLETLDKSVTSLHEYISRKQRQQLELSTSLIGMRKWNHRQKALLSHAVRNSHALYTIASHQTSHGITNQTARTDLLKLASAGLLTKEKDGNTFVFHPSTDLGKLLQQ
ncbi:MAG: Fic family protein [Akkermansiaceae bacterium]